jgi:hypothetical protein
MTRRAAWLALAAVVVLAVPGSSAAAPERDALIRMGRAIGNVELRMTLPQVRRALGGPHVSVYSRFDFGARGRYLELGWERPGPTSWEPIEWQVGFRSTSRRGPLRVVRVATTARRERTPRGIGIGSRVRDIVRAYPHATCVSRSHNIPYRFTWIVVQERSGGMTAFNIDSVLEPGEDRHAPRRVVKVMVQRDWFSKGRCHNDGCGPGWERG